MSKRTVALVGAVLLASFFASVIGGLVLVNRLAATLNLSLPF